MEKPSSVPAPQKRPTPVLGGVAAMVGLMTYYLHVVSPAFTKISWMNLLGLLGFLPYLFLTYIIVFFGLYTIYKGVIVSFSVWTILAGIFWVAIGYRSINCFYLMTEIVSAARRDAPAR